MSTVLFLGAGASFDAGYPLAGELLKKLKSKRNTLGNKEIHEKFFKFIDEFKKQQKIDSLSNVEIIFTYIDLIISSRDEILNNAHKKYIKQGLSVEDNKYYENLSGDENYNLSRESKVAMGYFSELVDNFFMDIYSNFEDKTEYLARGFSSLKQGDAIITTNWDILAEKILFSLNKWQPSDGYGFQRTFVKYNRRQNIHEELKIEPSQVLVLKLHGSIGWRLGDSKIYEEPILMLDKNYNLPSGKFYLVQTKYINLFSCRNCYWKDIDAPDREETPLDSSIMIRPSFIKPLNHPILQEIWKKATDALASAEKVIFIGYSLPEADMGIRVLLNPLRDRSSKKEVEIHVVDKNKNMELHWKSFLGDNIIFHNETAKKYLSEPF